MTPIVEKIGTYRTSVLKPEGRSQLGRSRHRWEDESDIDLLTTGYEGE